MSEPVEFGVAVLKFGDGATPTEVFTISCGKRDFTANFVANSTDRFVRDCATPWTPGFRKAKVTGKQLDITATGLTDKVAFGTELALLGTSPNIKLEYYTDGGVLMGTVACKMLVTALNIGAPTDGESTAEVTLASQGAWTYTAAA